MPASPYQIVTTAAGTMAIARVTSRRAQGGRRMSMKPSITIWPASVAVTVEFRPQHRSAMPNRVGALAEPSSGASSVCTSPSSATSVCPVLLKVAAARIRIDALMISAKHQRDRRIDGRELDRLALFLDALAEAARLHDARMQVQIVRHHGRADDAEREIEHVGIA